MVPLFNCSDSLLPYRCKLCEFSTNGQIDNRLYNRRHKYKNEVMCCEDLCGNNTISVFSMLWMLSHQVQHNQIGDTNRKIRSKKFVKSSRLFTCDQCKSTFSSKISLGYHLNAQHAADDKVVWYKCEKCSWKSKYLHHLQYHWRSKHSQERKPHHCSKCNYETYHAHLLRSHILHKHKSNYLRTRYSCKICPYRSQFQYYLNKHIEKLHTPDPFVLFHCDLCNFKTKTRYSLKIHLDSQHLADKHSRKYKCSECVYQTYSKFDLKQHMISKHTPDHLINWYNCNICLYRAKKKRVLDNHIRTLHTSEDDIKLGHLTESIKYQCTGCVYQTRSKFDLKQHITAKHTPDHLIDWHYCNICGHQAKLKRLLKRHIQTVHTSNVKVKKVRSSRPVGLFKCKECNATYINDFSLTHHMVFRHST